MWPNTQETADLVTFTEEILNGKLNFSCSVSSNICSIWFYDTRRSHRKYFKIYFSEWKKRLILFKKLLMCKLDNSKKVCLNCHCVTDKRSEKCLACGYTSKNYPSREILYGDRLLSKHFCLQPFCPKDSVFFTVCLVQFPWGNPRVDSKWKVDEIHVTRLPKNAFLTLFLTAEA